MGLLLYISYSGPSLRSSFQSARPRQTFLASDITRNAVLGLVWTFCLLYPSVNWPQIIVCGSRDWIVVISVTCGRLWASTVASRATFMSAAMAVAVALLIVVSSFITPSILAAAEAQRSRIGRMVFDDKRVIQFCAPAPLNNARIDTGRASHIYEVLDLFRGHQRRPGVQPVAPEARILVSGQVVERAEVPAGHHVRKVFRDESSEDPDVEVGSGGTGDERCPDPQCPRPPLVPHHIGKREHVCQDDGVVLPGERPVARNISLLEIVEDKIGLPSDGKKPVCRCHTAGVDGRVQPGCMC